MDSIETYQNTIADAIYLTTQAKFAEATAQLLVLLTPAQQKALLERIQENETE